MPPSTPPPGASRAVPPEQLSRERLLLLGARHAQAVKARYVIAGLGFVAASLGAAAAGGAHGGLGTPSWLQLAGPLSGAVTNVAADEARRRGWWRPWHFWAMSVADTLGMAVAAAALGAYGYAVLPFLLATVAAQALGLPRAGRVQLAAAAVAYPAARALGGAGAPVVVLETMCLLGLGWFALQAPERFTRRVRRARLALGALERGDFASRLPTRALDDLGFLGLSFNRTAAALGDAVEALRRSEARFRSLVQHSTDVIVVVGGDGRVRYVSPSVRREYGHAPEALVGSRAAAVLHAEDRRAAAGLFGERLGRAGVGRGAYRVRHADGTWRTVEAVCADLRDDPAVGGVVYNTRDVTERAALEAELARRAYTDPLTGLANRARFHERAEHALARAARGGRGVAVLLLDLDDFKTVNDSLGHAEGDRLLVEVAARLLHATRGSDTVARLGGDEFAVLLEAVDGDAEAVVVAERVLAALGRPFPLAGSAALAGAGGAEVASSASVGIARAGAGDDVDALLRDADAAMYRAKQRGKGCHELFAPGLHDAARERLVLHADLRRALDGDPAGGELFVAYQPIVGMDDGRPTGAEALARWRHPRRGLVPPSEFVPIAEQTGLVVPLGRFVLRAACRQGAAWAALGLRVRVGVNLSARHLPVAPADVRAALAEAGLEAWRLTLEVTEGTLVVDTDASREALAALKAMGVGLAIDDFGTGYSSLAYLQRFPLDVLKIDKRFVDGLGQGRGSALARTIVALGDSLGMYTVAEGVETEAQRAELLALGCRLGQGYLFARPGSPEEVTALLLATSGPVTAPPVTAPPATAGVQGSACTPAARQASAMAAAAAAARPGGASATSEEPAPLSVAPHAPAATAAAQAAS